MVNTETRRTKIRDVQSELRDRIVRGVYRPDERLPTFDAMEREFTVSRMVLQHAVGRLCQDGFVRTVRRKGLFVAKAPPHLYRIALLFSEAPGDPSWPRMNTAIVNESKRLAREHADWQFQVCDGLLNPLSGPGVLAAVEADLRARRLAGIVFTPRTFDLRKRPLLADAALPKAYVCAADDLDLAANTSVDSQGLYRRAIERLVAKGRRRIAIVHRSETTSSLDHEALFAACGVRLHRPWIQWVGRDHPQYAEPLVTLLLDRPSGERPDGLIVADDNLIEHAAAGIVKTGLRVGRDLDVVAHCNWPWPLASVLPFERIGFDATDILRRSIEAIVLQGQGRKPPCSQKVPALFEWEVSAPGGAPAVPPLRAAASGSGAGGSNRRSSTCR